MADRPFACPHCAKAFAEENARWQHARVKHSKKQAKALRPERPEREQSMGELVAEAQMNRAMGLPVDPIIAEMFDV